MTPHNQGLLKRLNVSLDEFTVDQQVTFAKQFENALNEFYNRTTPLNLQVTNNDIINTAIWTSIGGMATFQPDIMSYRLRQAALREIIGEMKITCSVEMQAVKIFITVQSPLILDLNTTISNIVHARFPPSNRPNAIINRGLDNSIKLYNTICTPPNNYQTTLKAADAHRFYDMGLIPQEISGILESTQEFYDTLSHDKEFMKSIAILASSTQKGVGLTGSVILSSQSNNSNNGAQKMSDELNKMKI